MRKVLVLAIAILVVFIAGCSGFGNGAVDVDKNNVIKVGYIGPLTGPVAASGEPVVNVVKLGVEEINAKGGVNGKFLELIVEDGGCDPKKGLNAMQKLVFVDNVEFVIGGLCSGETLGAAPLAEEHGVVLLSGSSTSPDVTNAGDFVFRTIPSDAYGASQVAEYANKKEYEKVGLLVEQNDYAQGQRRVFLETFNGEVVADEAFSPEDTDVRTQVTKIKSAEVDALFLVGGSPQKAAMALRDIKRIMPNVPILSSDVVDADIVLKEHKEAAEGMIFSATAFDAESENAQKIFAAYENKYSELSNAMPNYYYATNYDAILLLGDALTAAGEDPVAVKDYLYSVSDWKGVTGSLTIDSNGDALMPMELRIVRDGESLRFVD